MTGDLSLIRSGCYNMQQIGDNLEASRVAELLLCFIVGSVGLMPNASKATLGWASLLAAS